MGLMKEFENPNSKTVFSLAKKDSFLIYDKMKKFFNDNIDSEDEKARALAHNFGQKIIDKMLPTISISEKTVNTNGEVDGALAEVLFKMKEEISQRRQIDGIEEAEIVSGGESNE